MKNIIETPGKEKGEHVEEEIIKEIMQEKFLRLKENSQIERNAKMYD